VTSGVWSASAAFLVEAFPPRIRYTLDMSSCRTIFGNGWFGGFLPIIADEALSPAREIFTPVWRFPIVVGTDHGGRWLYLSPGTAQTKAFWAEVQPGGKPRGPMSSARARLIHGTK